MKKITNYLRFFMILATLVIFLIEISNHNYKRVLTFIAIVPLLYLPLILKKVNLKLNDKEQLLYIIFIFLADFLGSVVNLYNNIWWYDIFTHFISGMFTFVLGIIILNRINIKMSLKMIVFFCISISSSVALLWEVFEFVMDIILKIDLQHHHTTGVYDTMEDMIVALIGSILFGFYYYFKKRDNFCLKNQNMC